MKKAKEKTAQGMNARNDSLCDIFISYRRVDGAATAMLLYDILTGKGYRVFLDLNTLKNGNFNDAILQQIKHCKDFIIILSPQALQRLDDEDWVRKELACALREKKNIIPVMDPRFNFPDDLPEDIREIRNMNGITIYTQYIKAIVEKIVSFLITPPPNPPKRKWIPILGIILAILAVGTALAFGIWGNKGNVSPPSEGAGPTATETPSPTDIPAPTDTLAPTAAPTPTPTPTAVPSPAPAPTEEPTAKHTQKPYHTYTVDPKKDLAGLAIGDHVLFGHYDQDANEGNGQEDIEWVVLDSDGKTATLISQYCLDSKPFNNEVVFVTWETSSLRKWLNEEFLQSAFTETEQNRLETATVPAAYNPSYETDPGNSTQDKVYLLGIDEVNRFFTADEERVGLPTQTVISHSVETEADTGSVSWWLRSPGDNNLCKAFVYRNGKIIGIGLGVSHADCTVRPVITLRLAAAEAEQKSEQARGFIDGDYRWIGAGSTTLVEYLGSEKDIVLPKHGHKLFSSAFKDSDVESVVVPDSYYEFDFGVFINCKNLKKVVIENENIQVNAYQDLGVFIGCPNVVVYCHKDSETYETLLKTDGGEIRFIEDADSEATEKEDSSEGTDSYTQAKHAWGDYEPKGTVTVTMKDGTVYTGAANSFTLMAKRMKAASLGNEGFYEGIDTPDIENQYDLSNMKLFLEIASIKNRDGVFITVDDENVTTEYTLPQEAQFWFISTETTYTPEKVAAADVDKIEFNRAQTPNFDGLPYCTVYLEDGCFRSPAAFVCVSRNISTSGIPTMRIVHEFTSYSSYPTKTKSIASLEVLEQGSDGSMFTPATGMKMRVNLKNGETVDFEMNGYFSIYAMSQYGRIRSLSRSTLHSLIFEQPASADQTEAAASSTEIQSAAEERKVNKDYKSAAESAEAALQRELRGYFESVYVYKDFSDSENHFTQRALMCGKNASNVRAMNDNWQNDPHSGDSCIRCEIVTAEEDWGGWLFVNGYIPEGSAEPQLNQADAPNQGMNLQGASELRFWARGEQGGEMVQFLMGGYRVGAGSPYPDSCETQRTEYISLSTEWTEYTIDLSKADTSYLICGFGFAMNGSDSGAADNVFYLDDIRYVGYFSDAKPLLRSYDSNDANLKNIAFSYDNAVTAMAFISSGNQYAAKDILDSFLYAIAHDRYQAGRVRNAYVAGDITGIPGWSDYARIPVLYNAGSNSWQENGQHAGSSTGNTSYVALALLQYHARYGGDKYLDAAKQLMDWVLEECGASSPGFTAGYDGWPENGSGAVSTNTYKSIEHNVDAYAAFKRLAEVTGEQKYRDAADSALQFVLSMYDGKLGLFHTGTMSDGVTVNQENTVLDAQVWACLALGDQFEPYTAALKKVDAMQTKEGGYAFCEANNHGGWWAEGTAFAALMYRLRGDSQKSDAALDALCGIQLKNGLFPAATVDNLSTGIYLFDGTAWEYGSEAHIAPAAWFVMAVNQFNPYAFE